MPGKSVDTYLFALFDENLKPGPASERSLGLFKPDLTVAYDVMLSKTSQASIIEDYQLCFPFDLVNYFDSINGFYVACI